MFNWWAKQKVKDNPHWIHAPSKGTLYYYTKDELKHVIKRIFDLETEIMELEQADQEQKFNYTVISKRIFETKDQKYKLIRKKKKLEEQRYSIKNMVMTSITFRKILVNYNKEMVTQILDGNTAYLGARLGYVKIRGHKVKSKQGKRAVNWNETRKLKIKLLAEGKILKSNENPEGEPWIVQYDITEPYFRYSWVKNNNVCTVANGKIYGFYPSTGVCSNKKKLSAHLRANPTIISKYEII